MTSQNLFNDEDIAAARPPEGHPEPKLTGGIARLRVPIRDQKVLLTASLDDRPAPEHEARNRNLWFMPVRGLIKTLDYRPCPRPFLICGIGNGCIPNRSRYTTAY